MSGNNSLQFEKLQPLCVNFLKNCTIEIIDKIENVIQELCLHPIESPLQEYIALPFIVHLNSKLNEKTTIRCIDFLTLIFQKGRVKEFRFFRDIFSLMLSKISNFQDIYKGSDTSEELKLSVCENILHLVRCSTEEVLKEMYSLTFRPHLAHAFFVFNILLREEKSKALLKAALSTIGALAYNENYVGERHSMTELIASESLASCLPGLSIALQKIICGDDKQAHNIITLALNILINLITLTVGDKSYERDIANDSSSEIHQICYSVNKKDECRSADIPIVLKDKDWFRSVSEKLEIILKNITSLTTHNHWKVRLEFLKCSKLLLISCAKTLENCIHVLIPCVFELTVDQNEVISSCAKEILVSLSKNMQITNYSSFNSAIQINIEKLILHLITKKVSVNDKKKISTLKSLLGYIEISHITLNKLLFSMPQLEKLIMTLVTLLEFDVVDLHLLEELPNIQNMEVKNLIWPKKRFKYFENMEILNVICKICFSLRHIGNSRLLIDYLLQKISTSNMYTLECIFIIGSIIKGFSEESDAPTKHSVLINDVLEVFISSSLFDVPVHKDNMCIQEQVTTDEDLSDNILNKNQLQICLLLEAIANCSLCLQTEFKLHLMKILCPVMEKAGSSNFVISQCGQVCLHYITLSCKYKSVKELIKDNADYITNVIMINFGQYLHKPEIAIVLRVAMEYSDAEALVLFRDLIFQILDFIDYNQANAYPLLKVLFSVVFYLRKWFPCKKNSIPNNLLENSAAKSLKTLITDYISVKKSALGTKSEDDFETLNTDAAAESTNCEGNFEQKISETEDDCGIDENKPNIPLHVTIVCEIFKRCVHLQSLENPYLRMLALETVEMCILALREHENQLHPLVHEFWSPFLRRFAEEAFVPKAFNVLLAIANECGDFIRRRTSKDIIPKLCLFLQKERANSLLKCNFKQYQWTSDHALQILVLSEIGNLCTKLDINANDFNCVLTVCLPYLEENQPKTLQNAASNSMSALATIDPDSVWFYWNVLFCEEKILTPPHEDLLKLHFPFSNNSLTSVYLDL